MDWDVTPCNSWVAENERGSIIGVSMNNLINPLHPLVTGDILSNIEGVTSSVTGGVMRFVTRQR